MIICLRLLCYFLLLFQKNLLKHFHGPRKTCVLSCPRADRCGLGVTGCDPPQGRQAALPFPTGPGARALYWQQQQQQQRPQVATEKEAQEPIL